MANSISWTLSGTVQDMDAFRDLMNDMVASTRDEPGSQTYEWFYHGNDVHLLESYADNDALMAHLGNFGSKFADRFLALMQPTGFVVYGSPSDEARAALDGFGAQYMEPLGGFRR